MNRRLAWRLSLIAAGGLMVLLLLAVFLAYGSCASTRRSPCDPDGRPYVPLVSEPVAKDPGT